MRSVVQQRGVKPLSHGNTAKFRTNLHTTPTHIKVRNFLLKAWYLRSFLHVLITDSPVLPSPTRFSPTRFSPTRHHIVTSNVHPLLFIQYDFQYDIISHISPVSSITLAHVPIRHYIV